MNPQITIVIVIDIQAALQSNSLKDNIYLMDTQSEDGSAGEGTENLVTAVRNGYWCDQSQAGDVVLNWMPVGVNCLPPTLPKYYSEYRNKILYKERLRDLSSEPVMLASALQEDDSDFVLGRNGATLALGERAMNLDGRLFDAGKNSLDNLSFLTPQISAITGEAVDKGVIFPAQYGSPVPVKDGWYWSATVDTSRIGVYAYTLQITLYDRKGNTWVPITMEHHASIEVHSFPQTNGFTGAGVGYLPL